MFFAKPYLPQLYLITDPRYCREEDDYRALHQALEGGVRCLQYRNREASLAQKRRQLLQIRKLCNAYNCLLIVNDSIELCLEFNAEGVHLGQNDAELSSAREQLGPAAIIGATCHNSLSMAKEAKIQGCSYLAFGRFFPSQTKAQAPAATLEIFKVARHLDLPMVGIGGIDQSNLRRVFDAGANSVALCNAVLGAQDIRQQVIDLLRICRLENPIKDTAASSQTDDQKA